MLRRLAVLLLVAAVLVTAPPGTGEGAEPVTPVPVTCTACALRNRWPPTLMRQRVPARPPAGKT